MGYTTATFNGQTINIMSINSRKVQGTLKQRVGRTVARAQIIGRTILDWELSVDFIFTGGIDAARTTLIASNDADQHAYVDGVHDGNYIMLPQTLSFSETGGRESVLEGTMTLIQYQQ